MDRFDADGAHDGELIALLVVGEVRDDMCGVRVRLARLWRHEPAGQRGVRGRGEEVEGVPGVLPGATRSLLRVEDDEVQAEAAQVVAGGEPGLAAADHHHVHDLGHSASVFPRMKMTATRARPTAAPMICMPTKAGTEAGAMPAKVSVKARPIVTAGFAKDVDEVNQ